MTPQAIISAVAEHYEISPRRITRQDKHQTIARIRKLAMYCARQLTGCSYPEIGQAFKRHHTSVMNAVEIVESDPELFRVAENLISMLSGRLTTMHRGDISD